MVKRRLAVCHDMTGQQQSSKHYEAQRVTELCMENHPLRLARVPRRALLGTCPAGSSSSTHLLILEQQLLTERVHLLLQLGNRKGRALLLRACTQAARSAAAALQCYELVTQCRQFTLSLLHVGGQQLVLPQAPVELGLHLLQLCRRVPPCRALPVRLLRRPCCCLRLELSSRHRHTAGRHASGARGCRLVMPHALLLHRRWVLLAAGGRLRRLECLPTTVRSTAIAIYLLQRRPAAKLLLKVLLLGPKPWAALLQRWAVLVPRRWRLHRAGRLGTPLMSRGCLCGLRM